MLSQPPAYPQLQLRSQPQPRGCPLHWRTQSTGVMNQQIHPITGTFQHCPFSRPAKPFLSVRLSSLRSVLHSPAQSDGLAPVLLMVSRGRRTDTSATKALKVAENHQPRWWEDKVKSGSLALVYRPAAHIRFHQLDPLKRASPISETILTLLHKLPAVLRRAGGHVPHHHHTQSKGNWCLRQLENSVIR